MVADESMTSLEIVWTWPFLRSHALCAVDACDSKEAPKMRSQRRGQMRRQKWQPQVSTSAQCPSRHQIGVEWTVVVENIHEHMNLRDMIRKNHLRTLADSPTTINLSHEQAGLYLLPLTAAES
jgi:hypothetical protein